MSLELEYFYGSESEQFTFYRIPKILFKDKTFKNISAEAKVLYGLMLDRMSLSMRNGWFDDNNRVYIIYTLHEIMDDMGCADKKATKILKELDCKNGVGLIERKRQGLGKPDIIYVKNFAVITKTQNRENHDSRDDKTTSQEFPKSRNKDSENQESEIVNLTNQESRKSRTNNTNNNYTDISDNNKSETEIVSYQSDEIARERNEAEFTEQEKMKRWIDERRMYEEIIKENIKYQIIKNEYDLKWLNEIIVIMVDVVCSTEPYIRINKQNYPHEVVKSRFLKIDCSHIEYIFLSLQENRSKVRNIRAFLITTIFRSFETVDNWYNAKVSYDLNKERLEQNE